MSAQSTKAPWWIGVALALLLLINVSAHLYWLGQNVVLIGRDASGHLERTAQIATLLRQISPQTLFQALTYHDYRPPALYLFAQPFYQSFGHNMDSAQLTNVFLMALILLLTYGLAVQIVRPVVALLAVAMTAFLPILMGMSRLFYTENFLTAVFLLNLLALVKGNGFQRRGWALVWGITLGLALLVKWTAPIYLLLPTLWVLRAEVQTRWSAYRARQPQSLGHYLPLQWRSLLVAAVGALVITLAVYLPNQALIRTFFLGDWIAVGWFCLLTCCFYSYTRPVSVVTNVVTALVLGVALASFWYLPRIDFLTRLNDVAFGTDRGTQEAFDPWRLTNYTRYFAFLVREHLGLLAALLILPAGLLPWLGRSRGWRTARPGIVLLWSVLLSTYVFLAPLAQATERNLAPILPIIAILVADALRAYPRWLGVSLGIAWVGLLAFQFGLYTFDAGAPLQQRTASLWAQSEYLVQPATGVTDPGYWIAPDIFATLLETTAQNGEFPADKPVTLGMLIDNWEIHRGSFRYLLAEQQLPIELMALTESGSRGWSEMMANQWVLLKDGDNSEVAPPGQALLQRLAAGDPLFTALYQVVKRYPLPNGETASLYYRAVGSPRPQAFPVILIETAKLADAINDWWSPGATLFFSNPDVATWVGIHDLVADRIVVAQAPTDSVESLLADATGLIFAVTRYDTQQVQDALELTSDYVEEIGDGEFRLTVFWRSDQSLAPLPVAADWGDVQITGLRTTAPLVAGQVLPVLLTAQGQTDGVRKASVRLLDERGTVVAQADTALTPELRVMLFAPLARTPGIYTIAVILYDPNTLAPFLDETQQELVPLAPIQMVAP
ncbi:MAG: glycosyltransferase family 39 protein [Caldilineaceae bacterium]|nr:glycosyltransferase family 39 protein [Caldilineaceae bacterium]